MRVVLDYMICTCKCKMRGVLDYMICTCKCIMRGVLDYIICTCKCKMRGIPKLVLRHTNNEKKRLASQASNLRHHIVSIM